MRTSDFASGDPSRDDKATARGVSTRKKNKSLSFSKFSPPGEKKHAEIYLVRVSLINY